LLEILLEDPTEKKEKTRDDGRKKFKTGCKKINKINDVLLAVKINSSMHSTLSTK